MSTKLTYKELEQRVQELEQSESERKKTGELLWQQKKIFSLLVNYSSDILVLIDKNGEQKFISPSAEKITGYTVGELQRPFAEIIHPEDLHQVERGFEELLNNPEAVVTVNYRHKHKDGGYRYFETVGRNFLDNPLVQGIVANVRDITERKGVEEELRKSEDRFRYLSDASMEAIFFTREGFCLEANQVAVEMFGYDDRSEFIGMFGTEIIAPESHEIVKENMLKNILEPYEAVGERKDGTRFPIAIRAKEMPYKDKGIIRATSIMDISDRKQAEEALYESEAKYKSLTNNLNVGVYRNSVDSKGKFIQANPAIVKMFGYDSREEFLKIGVSDLYKDSLERDEFIFKIAKAGSIKNEILELQKKDGTGFIGSVSAVAVMNNNGEIKYFDGIIEDITERKRAEEALRESEEKYRTILEDLEDGYFEVDIAGNLTFSNSSLCRIFGYSKDELMGMNNRQYTDEENAKKLYQTFNRVYTTGKSDKGFDWKIIRKDGNKRLVETSISPKKGSEGQPIGFQGIVRDVSDRRQIEKDKAKLEARLQRGQKMEAIGTLAGGVAHDLNNILGGLVSYPELLLLQLPEDSPLRKSILTIQKSGEKAAAVVQDLLTLARRGVVTTEVVNLNDVISEYLESPEHMTLQSYHPGVHIETHFEEDALNILGSSAHLSKSVMNLVSNAAEAMPEGGALTVSTENRYIDRPIRGYDDVKEADYVVLTVSDTGTGISPDDIGKIFEPFYTKKKMGRSGTGLGMAVVWGTVKDHNGYIDVQSTEGKGTTFTLYFPVTRNKLTEDKFHSAIESYSGNGESILIVDDVEEQRNIASGMLEELGYSVVSVSSGEAAVEYLKTRKVDLLVLDMIMDPGLDGFETYKKILELHPGQKAVIASGFSETDRVKKLQGLGAGRYIKKPFLLEKIGLAVRDELKNRPKGNVSG